jgi:glycosyltransferase involved in cell wall biosynthesis
MKFGIVIPWFGRELKGGAEQHAWQIAVRLAARGHSVEVLTTCCKSHQDDWETNHFPEGISTEPEGIRIRRFAVVARDRARFDTVCARLLQMDPASLKPGVPPVSHEESRIFTSELIKSPRLLEFITAQGDEYDRFILLPYLYGPVLDAIKIVGKRGALIPCLHDESYAYLPEIAEAIYQVGSLLFISEGEQELAYRLFGSAIAHKSSFVGAGVEAVPTPEPAPSNGADHQGGYLLYLGRKDPGKNVPLLLNAFGRFRAVRPNSNLRLVLAGPGSPPALPPKTLDAGIVSDEQKGALLRDCVALLQPSQNESFSRVMMEAWFHGKPVAVHAGCAATAIPVKKSQGGWIAESEDDWARLFVEIDRTAERDRMTLGANGRRYAAGAADWESVMDRYEAALADRRDLSVRVVQPSAKPIAINQFLPNLTYGDAISNEAIWIRDQIRAAGFASDIFVQFLDPRVAHECHVFTREALQQTDALIYHHSIGAEMTPHLVEFGGPKYLIYHNITPGEFFENYRPGFASILYRGRDDLRTLALHFQNSVGDSAFNAAELVTCGFRDPGVLPLAVDPAKWTFPPDPEVMHKMQDGRSNILFVGRVAPNKKQDDLVRAFSHYLRHDPDARLVLVGKPEEADPYVDYVQGLIADLGLADSVLVPGSIQDSQLAAYYRTAHLFWSMSEHEGFCVPLIESMWFDVPIFAFKSSAVPETLGDAALLFSTKDDLAGIAAFGSFLVKDATTREKLIRAQRRRRLDFLPEKVLPALTVMLDRLCLPVALTPKQRRTNGKSLEPAAAAGE